ncbi:Hsp70 family protein [Fertoebacter nigrum]|uniref:Hsp70 family protein n=1 Tax=Fertoeibacter niger TaxID=2656921 RepID=A0A8X8GZC1_9RHOB|nr:Hsp70 family protein [Fertoeibacter niger]NUB43274.1 Hsp70 family protein [Fertoeibacter niger]
MTAPFCGIDFGTSNSTVALADATGARLIALEGAHRTLPSAVFWDADGAPPQFGRAAMAAYTGGEDGRLMRGLKSTLGSSLIHEKTRVGNKALAFTQIVGSFFAHLRARVVAEAGEVTRAVLGRPVHFVDDDASGDAAAQDVLEGIARAQGFTEVAFQYEPIAAALHYEQGVAAEELVLIVDIGGGTSDFSIVRVSPERARAADRQADILANDGIRVGGTDFDRLLSLAQVMPHLGFGAATADGKGLMPRHYFIDLATWHRINALYTARTMADLKALRHLIARPVLMDRMMRVVGQRHGHALALATEEAKIALSVASDAPIRIGAFTGGPDASASRAGFEAAVEAPLLRIRAALENILAQAGLAPGDIGTVFMTGGSSSLPVLHAAVAAVLPGVPVATGDLLGSVGTGLALDARRKFG